jgi:demethylmenaquinone methyltransferase / 2-methoxy-6-polyprenyl-1,4-benzoquinol methylase
VTAAQSETDRNRFARRLFAPLAESYDRGATFLSFGQDPRWRRFLVSRVDVGSHDEVLDVATGTAAVAIELIRRRGCRVVGVDQSAEMLAAGRQRVEEAGVTDRISLVESRAEALPFAAGRFDALTFTYLLRYVDDPAATLRELARVVKPGGAVAGLEFSIPGRAVPRALWDFYVDTGLPALGRLASPGWHEVGQFLGRSIRDFYDRYPLDRVLTLWRDAGIADVRARPLSFGGGVVIWGRRGD